MISWIQECVGPTPHSCDSELCVSDVDVCVEITENVMKTCICSQEDRLGTYLRVLCNLQCVNVATVTLNYYVGYMPMIF